MGRRNVLRNPNVGPFQTCQSICTTAGDALFCFLLCLRSRLTRILSTFPEFQKSEISHLNGLASLMI